MQLGINTATMDLTDDFEPVPAGLYPAQIVSEESKPTLSGGERLVLKFRIYGDKYQGRTVFGSYNVNCPSSATAQSIAFKQLGKLCRACGCSNVGDSSELIYKACRIRVVIEKDQNGIDRNEIKGYEVSDGNPPASVSVGAPAPAKQWFER